MPKNLFLNWLHYSHTEQKYATLLDIQIRNAFQKLKLSDFDNPAGFANLKNASRELKSFFECRKIFEQFIGDDITENTQQKDPLRAFKKWMNIAEILLQKHNYEAYCLVVYRLSQIDMDLKLSQELSTKNRNSFDTLESFASPKNNFSALRRHMESNQDPRKLSPTFILSKDITTLNEIQGKDKESRQKETILSQSAPQKRHNIPDLSKHLKNTFKLIAERYHSKQSEVVMQETSQQLLVKPLSIIQRESVGSHAVSKLPKASNLPKSEWQSSTPIYNIYGQKISPSFWTRCIHDHCKKMLTAEEFSPQRHP
ncbi:RasGEF domain-containing protein [Legionella drancourtii]|uniref:Ras-GEF domain-containing protein n=1 Tax=Legionella drancourtii LLAP12 TaxID=658187 RepID=G9ERN4_9GAMM|nr:RasGEF domain-containing protein [Legionella drancourtii]EHL30047.1 hypothetical protein LDG_7951 [Legionella drancourtii LLAP12]